MTDSKIVSLSAFKQGRGEEPEEAPAEITTKRRWNFLASKATWYVILEVVRFGGLSGAAWMLFSHPTAMMEYGDLVWLLSWIAYAVIGAGLIAHAMDFQFHSFLLNCLYFVAGVVLLFYETWLGVVVLLPYAMLLWPFSSDRVYVVRPF
jgi:hypothetical protein